MGPEQPRRPDDEGPHRPRDADADFIFDDPAFVDDDDDLPRTPGNTRAASAGPGFADNASYSDGASYSPDAGFGDSLYDDPTPTAGGAAPPPPPGRRPPGTGGWDDDDFNDDLGDGRGGQRRPGQGYVPPDFTDEELAGLGTDENGMPTGPRRVLPLEDEPSTLVARYLFPTERYRGEWKRHFIHLTTPVLVGVGVTLLLGYLSGFLAKKNVDGMTTAVVLLWLGVMGWVGWNIADWYFDRFILTNKRVMVVNGI